MECKQCGHCCTYVQFTLPNDAEGQDKANFYQLHGCRVLKNEKQIRVYIPTTCAWLAQDQETKKYFCADYENRPEVCRKYQCSKGR